MKICQGKENTMSFGKIIDIFSNLFKKPTQGVPPSVDVFPEEPAEENNEPKLVSIPDRKSSAVTGSQFIANNLNLSGSARENNIIQELSSGNIPNFLRNLVAITVSNATDRVTYYVMSDYICIGSDNDYVRIPTNPHTAQTIADLYGCSLPTKKMVNDIWKFSPIKLSPKPIPPDSKMGSTKRYDDHNKMVQNQLVGKNFDALISGHKKDVVLTNRLHPNNPNKRVAIYGWIQSNGVPIQDLNPTSHDDLYADYSHGIRFISNKVLVNDATVSILDVFKDAKLSPLLSLEGVLNFTRY